MPSFALLFRSTRPVADDELPRRNAAARDWALALRAQGKLLGASPLEDTGSIVGQGGVTPLDTTRSLASVLVVEAVDFDGAVGLAKGHPGLAYGTEIEIRPLKVVAPAPEARS